MNEARIREMAADIYNDVFVMLDADPAITGEDAGMVATDVERAFIKAMKELFDA